MTQEHSLIISEDRQIAIHELETRFAMAVRQRELLENYIRERLKPDKHFYTVNDEPGRKPSLTKEGAELICLPHNLKPRYIILSGPEKPPSDNSPYQITVNCSLCRGEGLEGEGIGSASSYITKKDGTFQPRQKDPGLCHNATVKMACKSAYIGATLNSTAASEFFTQDIEDDQTSGTDKPESKGHYCSEHKTVFFKKGRMTAFAHPIVDSKDWCYEHKEVEKVSSARGEELKQKIDETIAKVATEKASAPLTPNEANEKGKVKSTMEETVKDSTVPIKDRIFSKIAENMGWRDTKSVQSWLVNKCGISEARITADPQAVWEEVRDSQGWKD